MEKRGEKGQVSIVVISLIILIAVVLILIVWNVVIPLVRERSEETGIGKFSVNLDIEDVIVFEQGVIHVNVKRSSGGELDGLRFVFYDENGNSENRDGGSINELETKTYAFSSIQGLDKIERVVVVPVIDGNLGIEDEAETSDVLEVPFGVVNWLKFDEASGDFITYHSNNLSFEDQMGISFWVQNTGSIKGDDYEVLVGDKVNFSYNGEIFQSIYDLEEQWNHVVVSVDISNPTGSRIYINNEPEVFSVSGLSISSNIEAFGEVDDVMLFNKALSNLDVNGLYVYQKK